MGKERFDKFDLNILRGLAILGIIAVHTDQMVPDVNKWIGALSEIGQMGCQLFFLLSGFCLCFSWGQNKSDFIPHYKYFLKKRWKKIAIPYYCIIFIQLLYVAIVNFLQIPTILGKSVDPLGIVCLILGINGMIPPYYNYFIMGSWFIGTLFILYILFPLVFEKSPVFLSKNWRSVCGWQAVCRLYGP